MRLNSSQSEERPEVLIVGIGSMGGAMALRLRECGVVTSAYARVGSRHAEGLKKAGVPLVRDLGADPVRPDVVLLSLPDSEAVSDVIFGRDDTLGLVSNMAPGSLIIDTSTIAPAEAALNAAKLSEFDLEYLESPVSGGPQKAREGTLTALIAGSISAQHRASFVIRNLTETIHLFNERGLAQTAKACNNLLIGAIMLANSEVLRLGEAAGIDPVTLQRTLSSGTASNWQLENIVPKTILRNSFSPLFEIGLLIKDLGIASDLSNKYDIKLPFVNSALSQYRRAMDKFGDNVDFSSVYRLSERDG